MNEKVSIIGAGSWGTTLAVILAKKGVEVELYSVFNEHNIAMQKERENRLFLKGTKFPAKLQINPSLKDILNNPVIVIAVPVKFIRKTLKNIKREKFILEDKIFVSVSKGIEVKSLKRVSEVIKEELGEVFVAVLSGPTIAKEVLAGLPTTAVIASEEESILPELQELFTTSTFRAYLCQDVIGVELGGALKNIIAVACGISDGLGFGTNTKSALVTRGLVEITRLGEKLGANPLTFWGISGLGDLATTCFSPYSRNRCVGEKVGKGAKVKEILNKMDMVAEGVETVKSAFNLSNKLNIDMPITREVYAVLYKNKPAYKAVKSLMERPLKRERGY